MHHHHANAAAQAFTRFGAITHHGAGEAWFWVAIVILVLIGLASRNRSRA